MERQAVKIVRPARKGKAPLRRRLGGLLFSLFRFCVLFGLIFLIVYPFLFMFVTAFRGSEDLNDPSVVWITRHYTLNNFHNFLQMVDFGDMMGNTVVISLSSAVRRPSCAAWRATASPASASGAGTCCSACSCSPSSCRLKPTSRSCSACSGFLSRSS